MRFLLLVGTFLMLIACTQQSDKTRSGLNHSDSSMYVTVVLRVNGMTCEGCENTISKSVGSLDGIKKVSASHIDSTTLVVYDSSLININMIGEKIDEIGYKVNGVVN